MAATVIINDEVLTCPEGDNLLRVAREHGSHVWFVCDGRGVCRTCICRVLSGAENLSPPTSIERESLSDAERRDGYRLSCQAQIIGYGTVRVLSVAEALRRHLVRIARPDGTGRADPLLRLLRELADVGLNAATSLPFVPIRALPQIVGTPPTASGIVRYVRDAQRMVWRLWWNP